MMTLLKWLWKVANMLWEGALSLSGAWFWVVVLAFHLCLAVATVACSGRSICDLVAPVRGLFSLSWDAVADGVLELVFGIPRMLVYALLLYFHAYVLLARVLLLTWVAAIPALLCLMALLFVVGWPLELVGVQFDAALLDILMLLVFLLGWACFYWRIDGRRLWRNMQRSLECVRG